jgi:S1-C subfamily serine protease
MLKRAILLLVAVCTPIQAAQLSPKDILSKNRDAVVQIFVSGEFSGTGFIISQDGLVATANHVVTTEESKYMEFAKTIEIKIRGDKRLHFARPLLPVTADSRNFDIAIVKMEKIGLPTVTLGDWNEAEEADPITVIASLYGTGETLVVNGIISAKGKSKSSIIGPGNVNTVLFQAPVRKGVSGSPLFSNATGHVIGVVTTRVFGISNDLDSTRKRIDDARKQVAVGMYGIDVGATLVGLIDNLDANLVSGLGSAVDIFYAKQMQAEIQNKKN